MKETKAVVKGIILRDGKVLTIRRSFQDKIGAGSWEVVGGKIEFGETLDEALKREVLEETGIKINILETLYAKNTVTDENTQMVVIVYLCNYVSGEVGLSEEHVAYRWVSVEGLKDIISPNIKKDFEDNRVFEIISSKL